MKKNIIYILGFICLCFFACKKNQLDGKSTIKGAVKHHSKEIANATVFIKFNAKEFPGADTNGYNAKVVADADGNYNIKCYKGDYYLYAIGHDYALPPPYEVKGGVPVHIRNRENVEIEIAVTE
ncbi:MAG: hypothetical protein ABIP51_10850 [Bacteroidia bacterium]